MAAVWKQVNHTHIVSIDTPFKASSCKDCIWLLERSLEQRWSQIAVCYTTDLRQTQRNKTKCNWVVTMSDCSLPLKDMQITKNVINWYLQCLYGRSRISKQLSGNSLNGIVLKFTKRKKWNWITKKLMKIKCQVAWKTQAADHLPPPTLESAKSKTVTTTSLGNTVFYDIFKNV